MAARGRGARRRSGNQRRSVAARLGFLRKRGVRLGIIGGAATAAVAVIIVLGLLLQPGGGGESKPQEGETGGAPVPPTAMEVPDFTVKTTSWSGGRDFTLSRNLDKPTALYFVAAWCFTCIPETQALARIHQEMGDQVNIIIFDVDTRENEGNLLRFKERADGGDHLWAMDGENRVARAYDVRFLDTTIIVDQKGKEVYRDSVPTPYDKLKSVLTKTLAGEAVAKETPNPLSGQFYPDQGRRHLQPGEAYDGYNSNPPTSGPHDPKPAPWGIYDQPLPKEVLVHNLEHGGVLILHRCTNCPEIARQLREFAEGYLKLGRKVIVAPYPEMEAGFALVAWTYLDTSSVLDPARLSQFMADETWRKAPEANVD